MVLRVVAGIDSLLYTAEEQQIVRRIDAVQQPQQLHRLHSDLVTATAEDPAEAESCRRREKHYEQPHTYYIFSEAWIWRSWTG